MYIWIKAKKLKRELKWVLEREKDIGNMEGKDEGESVTREKRRGGSTKIQLCFKMK